MFENQYIDYAADMTILLAYYKCKDDWKDEAKKMEAAYGTMLEKHVGRIEEIYPRQVNCVKMSIERLNQLENSSGTTTDEIVNCSGKMLTEIFVYQEDFWSGSDERSCCNAACGRSCGTGEEGALHSRDHKY